MPPLDFQNPPITVGTSLNGPDGQRWVWDGDKWVFGGGTMVGGPFLPLAGGTVTGQVIIQNNSIALRGPNTEYIFDDWTTGGTDSWSLYADGNQARLFSYTTNQDTLTVDMDGMVNAPALRTTVGGVTIRGGSVLYSSYNNNNPASLIGVDQTNNVVRIAYNAPATVEIGPAPTGSPIIVLRADGTTQFAADIYGPRLRGGLNDGGTLRSGNSGNSITFGWASPALQRNIDGAGWVSLADASDVRIKDNIAISDVDALSIINQIPVKQYNIKAEIADIVSRPYYVRLGLVADDVQPLIPEMVIALPKGIQQDNCPLPDGMLSIEHEKAVPYLIRAVQQLSARLLTIEGES